MKSFPSDLQDYTKKIKIHNKASLSKIRVKDDVSSAKKLRPIDFCDIEIKGELAYRCLLNFTRLEGEEYRPENIFQTTNYAWPGDWEGRAILGLTLLNRATHRTASFLEEIISILPQKLNEKGYLGKLQPEGFINEQQIAGHSWMLRGLLEYYEWQKDNNVLEIINSIVNNLLLPLKGHYATYPIDYETRSRDIAGEWQLSWTKTDNSNPADTTDTGCAFIMLDGATHAYKILRNPELKELIEEMIAKFMEINFVKMHTQTHATLTALRGILRYYELEKNPKYLKFAEQVFKLYKTEAWTENYANYNWFDNGKWTEGCALFDSFIVAVWLWKLTGDSQYLEDAHHIYYNAIAYGQRINGGFATENCLGINEVFLYPLLYEATWCCCMRAGEGFARAIEYNFFTHNGDLIVPFYNDCTADLYFTDGMIRVVETSSYPYEGKVNLNILESTCTKEKVLRLFIPSWCQSDDIKIDINGKRINHKLTDGFALLKAVLKKGDKLDVDFVMGLHVKNAVNTNNLKDCYTFRHGPLILACKSSNEIMLNRNDEFIAMHKAKYKHKNSGTILSPLNNLADMTSPNSKKQVLFRSC